jgi:hypothetical protein
MQVRKIKLFSISYVSLIFLPSLGFCQATRAIYLKHPPLIVREAPSLTIYSNPNITMALACNHGPNNYKGTKP